MTDTLNQSRAFATVTVPSAGIPNIVAIATIAKQLRLEAVLWMDPAFVPGSGSGIICFGSRLRQK